jgi:hypothetical protein
MIYIYMYVCVCVCRIQFWEILHIKLLIYVIGSGAVAFVFDLVRAAVCIPLHSGHRQTLSFIKWVVET